MALPSTVTVWPGTWTSDMTYEKNVSIIGAAYHLSDDEIDELRSKYPNRAAEGWGIIDTGICPHRYKDNDSFPGSHDAARELAFSLHPELRTWFAVRRLCAK